MLKLWYNLTDYQRIVQLFLSKGVAPTNYDMLSSFAIVILSSTN